MSGEGKATKPDNGNLSPNRDASFDTVNLPGAQGAVLGSVGTVNNYFGWPGELIKQLLEERNQSRGGTAKSTAIKSHLHYLCDRGDQEKEFRRLVVNLANSAARRPVVCVIHGDAREAHLPFVHRLEHHTLPTRLRAMADAGAFKFYYLPKPSLAENGEQFAAEFRREITDKLGGRECQTQEEFLQQLRDARVRLIALVTTIRSDEPESKTTYLELVRDFWARSPDLPEGLIVISFVLAKLDGAEAPTAWRKAWSKMLGRRSLPESIDGFAKAAETEKNVICHVFEKLKSVNKAHIDEWAMHEEVTARLKRRVSEDYLKTVFAGRAAIPMEEALEALAQLID